MVAISGQIIWIPLTCYFLWYSFKTSEAKSTGLFFLFLLLTLIASDVTSSYILKNIFLRLRPCRLADLQSVIYQFGQKCGGKFGFVSSHAANSISLILFSIKSLKIKNKKISFLLLIPLIVGYSRIYLGVHYPGDIIGGLIVGSIWSLFFSYLYRSIQGANR